MAWLPYFDRTCLFDSNPWSERAHTLLTASARFAQCTGVFALNLFALVLVAHITVVIIVTIACAAIACISLDDLGLAYF